MFVRDRRFCCFFTQGVQDILSGLKWAEHEDKVKVILQTGGGKIFTAGLDLKDKSVAEPGTVISVPFLKTLRYKETGSLPLSEC